MLKKLGGFAATLIKSEDMMTQLGHAPRGQGARAKMLSHVRTLISVLSLIGGMMVCVGASAHPTEYTTPHTRPGAVHRSHKAAAKIVASHTPARSSRAGLKLRPAVRPASSRRELAYQPGAKREQPRAERGRPQPNHTARLEPVGVHRRQLRSRHQPLHAASVRVARRSAAGKRRVPTAHRVNLRHGRPRRGRRSSEPEVLARAEGVEALRSGAERSAEQRPAVAAQVRDQTPGQTTGPVSGPSYGQSSHQGPLTVDDFMRAAGPGSRSNPVSGQDPIAPLMAGAYATGVAHPDEDVSLAQTHAASPATGEDAAAPETEPAGPETSGRSMIPATEAATQEQPAAGSEQVAAASFAPPIDQPVLYRRGRLLLTPPLRGSREILEHQNLMADAEGLNRISDDAELRQMRAEHMLVDFPESAALRLNPEMESDRRCARPWTVLFAANIARAYYARFHQPLQVNSAVRTVAYQLRLRRVNGNAAGIEGDLASPHLTGEAMDFGKHGMTRAEIAWMRLYLRPLMQQGKLDVEEEFHQACFHISVYRTYAPNLPMTGPRDGSEFARAGQLETNGAQLQTVGADQ